MDSGRICLCLRKSLYWLIAKDFGRSKSVILHTWVSFMSRRRSAASNTSAASICYYRAVKLAAHRLHVASGGVKLQLPDSPSTPCGYSPLGVSFPSNFPFSTPEVGHFGTASSAGGACGLGCLRGTVKKSP